MADKQEKVTIMILNVNLQCPKCYKKVKKALCKFPQIRDQVYDEKANKVTIKVVCCSPEKIRDKLCYKGGGSIKSIEIKEPEKKPKEPKKPEDKKVEKKEEPKKPDEKKEDPRVKPKGRPEERKNGQERPRSPGKYIYEGYLRYPASPEIGFWCGEGSSHSGMPGNPYCRGGPVQYDGYYGRPIYDSWGGGRCNYFSEENHQSCSIM